ncbi:DUF7511 domain-containing protein [Natrinema gelatinilyticum]|uniref:DUF7511 domain-containing protein n=1 Tax=Natrinema gelatinilyticum TaxID=2961571 RepID=UPI0020C24F34|nr:hypothetical protein [Natrinema gelatinilyticum]
MSESPRKAPGKSGSTVDERDHLQHVTVQKDNVAVCTIFPREIGENAASEQWITAMTDSFVTLEQRR